MQELGQIVLCSATFPDNATIVLGKPRIIEHEEPVEYYAGGSYEWKDRRWPEDREDDL